MWKKWSVTSVRCTEHRNTEQCHRRFLDIIPPWARDYVSMVANILDKVLCRPVEDQMCIWTGHIRCHSFAVKGKETLSRIIDASMISQSNVMGHEQGFMYHLNLLFSIWWFDELWAISNAPHQDAYDGICSFHVSLQETLCRIIYACMIS